MSSSHLLIYFRLVLRVSLESKGSFTIAACKVLHIYLVIYLIEPSDIHNLFYSGLICQLLVSFTVILCYFIRKSKCLSPCRFPFVLYNISNKLKNSNYTLELDGITEGGGNIRFGLKFASSLGFNFSQSNLSRFRLLAQIVEEQFI